jgi:hypothetical protein
MLNSREKPQSDELQGSTGSCRATPKNLKLAQVTGKLTGPRQGPIASPVGVARGFVIGDAIRHRGGPGPAVAMVPITASQHSSQEG